MNESHAIPIHASTPMPRFSKTSGGGSSTAAAAPRVPSMRSVSADSSTADPWVEDAVEHVHRDVDEHVHDRDDRDVVLQRDVLAAVDGIADREAEAVEMEDDLNDQGPPDELPDVQAGHGPQRQARP